MTFPTTNWATLAEATLSGGEEERAALGRFCERYWKPVSIAIQARGVPSDRVEDLTQDFFLKLMEGGFVRRATQQKGRFRNFLLKTLKDFLTDDFRKNTALKRGGAMTRVELEDHSASFEDSSLHFDCAWAEAVFDTAVKVTGEDIRNRRSDAEWELLQFFLTGSGEEVTYEKLSSVLGSSEGAAKTEVSRMRAKFRENLRNEVAKTVSSPHEVDEELAFLREVMMKNE